MPPADPAFRQWVDQARDTPIADVCAGRSLRLRGTVERVGPCPNCGGRDRFGINTRKNIFRCRGCKPEGGGPIDLVMHLDGVPFGAAVEILTGRPSPSGQDSGITPEVLAEIEAERARKRAEREAASAIWSENERAKIRRWWERAKPAPGTPVEAYLRLRGVDLPVGAKLRFHPNLTLWDDRRDAEGKRKSVEVHRGPAMLAAIAGPDGHFSGLHMTWLDLSAPDGKARVSDPETGELTPAKKIRGTKAAGRIELVRAEEPRRLFLGEGIETTLSVWRAMRDVGLSRPGDVYWSAIDLGNLGGRHAFTVRHPELRQVDKIGRSRPVNVEGPVPDLDVPAIPIPDSVAEVVTLGDGDSDPFTTRQAHLRAEARWTRPGRFVRAVFAPAGTDFNTMIRATSA